MAKGDAMGKQVSSLYISLGLNADDLQLGFKVAGQTVKQAIARLNSEANQIRLRADIDVTRLEAAGKHVDALKAREKALNDELTIQQKKLELLNRAYEYNAKTFGTDHGNTRGVETKRLYQTRDIERLKAQISASNAELGKTETKATTAFGKLKAEAAKANGSVKSMVSDYNGKTQLLPTLSEMGKSFSRLKNPNGYLLSGGTEHQQKPVIKNNVDFVDFVETLYSQWIEGLFLC